MTQSIAIGAMAETPVALLDIRNWLNDADFIAIGTNDLMQCLFAADRDLPEMRRYLNPYMPVLFRILMQAAREAAGKIHKVQVCGLLAQMPGILPLLLAMGYRKFSVESTGIPYLAQTIKETNVTNTQRLVKQVCAASNTKIVCKLLGVPVATIWLDR